MDETSKQLMSEVQAPLPPQPGHIARQDYEYERNGVCNLFICFEPLQSRRHVQIADQRTAIDWAYFMRDVADVYYPDAKKIVAVMDNLNTHGPGSFYEAFAPMKPNGSRHALNFITRPSMALGSTWQRSN